MHLLRRAAFRALAARPATSVAGRRSAAPFAPLIVESWTAPFASIVRRGFASDETETRSYEPAVRGDDPAEAADGEVRPGGASAFTGGPPIRIERVPAGGRAADGPLSGSRNGFARTPFAQGEYGGAGRGRQQSISPSNVIYIGNIQFEIPEQDLKEDFARYGSISTVELATDSMGRSKGFAYVHYGTIQEADAAIEAMDGAAYHGRRIVVGYRIKSEGQVSIGDKQPTRTVYVGNLPYEMTDVDLNKLFREIPEVGEVRVSVDRRTGQLRGFVHVEFKDVKAAKRCVELLDGRVIMGRRLRIDYAETRKTLLPSDSDLDTPGEKAPEQ